MDVRFFVVRISGEFSNIGKEIVLVGKRVDKTLLKQLFRGDETGN